ncbi:MAG: DUF1003 domain-containing protein [Deltaproteobacteria bacterium]|nr:MAG: DUF1003 domain-containing protein [Deltaproteobacteria bacterium]
MGHNANARVVCQICGQSKGLDEVWPGELVRGGVQQAVLREFPQWSPKGYICQEDLNHFRGKYVEEALREGMGEITTLQNGMVQSLKEHELLSRNINVAFEEELTFWERLSDKVAAIGGSWGFILGFLLLTGFWFAINSYVWIFRPFDPYPFIFLNLVFSLMSAVQAPIILMSQNRQDAKDRLRSEYDYRVNLKAELEIRHLNEKMDLLLTQQWRRLLEIQQVQLAVMESLTNKFKHS